MSNGNGNGNGLARVEAIEGKIDRAVTSQIVVSSKNGMAIESMSQAMEVAKLMSVSGSAVPRHLRGNPGACLAIAIQGWEWAINPFHIANKSYEVNDRIGYEATIYASVLTRRAPIQGRLKIEYIGDGPNRKCKVWAKCLDGEVVEYTTPAIGTIKPKNSPLWVNDPDQQLYYFAVRSFARRHFSDVMMGIQTVDELQDGDAPAQPQESRAKAVISQITQRPVSEGQTFEPDATAAPADSVIDAEVTPAPAPAPVPTAPAPGPSLPQSWAECMDRLADIASTRGDDEGVMNTSINAWKLRNKRQGPAEWAALVAAFDAGKLNADGTIQG